MAGCPPGVENGLLDVISIALHGSLFRHMGIFLLRDLSTHGSLFRHTFPKNSLNIKIYAFRIIFLSQKLHF
jgi:hypothetical protein